VLTPRPRVNLILYYGVLAPRASWRSALVPATANDVHASDAESSGEADGDASRAAESRAGAYQWAELMRRTFGVEVLACPRCGGRLRLVALIDQASVIQRILRHLGLPTDVPEPRPARAPPSTLTRPRISLERPPTSTPAGEGVASRGEGCRRGTPPLSQPVVFPLSFRAGLSQIGSRQRPYPRCRRGRG
jgi:hypothetical protein